MKSIVIISLIGNQFVTSGEIFTFFPVPRTIQVYENDVVFFLFFFLATILFQIFIKNLIKNCLLTNVSCFSLFSCFFLLINLTVFFVLYSKASDAD